MNRTQELMMLLQREIEVTQDYSESEQKQYLFDLIQNAIEQYEQEKEWAFQNFKNRIEEIRKQIGNMKNIE